MPTRSRSKTASKSTPEPISNNNTNNKGASTEQKIQIWKKLFQEIDTNDSGTIDVDEMFEAISAIYPQLERRWNSNIVAMIDEADGEIDEDEFLAIMGAAHDQNDLWGIVNTSMYSNMKRNIVSVGNAIHSTADVFTAPIRQMSADHSYLVVKKDGKIEARISVGMRVLGSVGTVFVLSMIVFLCIIPGLAYNDNLPGMIFVGLGGLVAGLVIIGMTVAGFMKGKDFTCLLFGWHYKDSKTGKTFGGLEMFMTSLINFCIWLPITVVSEVDPSSAMTSYILSSIYVVMHFALFASTNRDLSQHIMDYDVVLDK